MAPIPPEDDDDEEEVEFEEDDEDDDAADEAADDEPDFGLVDEDKVELDFGFEEELLDLHLPRFA